MYAQTLLILAIASIALTILSTRMKTDVFPPSPYVFVLRFLHFFALLFVITYIFLFPQKTTHDVIFISYCVLLIIHLGIFGDCILNLLERQHYQKDVPNIYLYTILDKYTREFMMLVISIVAIYVLLVLHRQKWLSSILRISLMFISVPIAAFVMYLQYKLEYEVRLKNNN